MQVDDAAVKAVKGDVATILRHGWAHPAVEQFFDLVDDLSVFAGVFGVT